MTARPRRDFLDSHATLHERIRKLEVTQQALVYRPRQWKNNETLLDVAAQLVAAQSDWALNNYVPPDSTNPWPRVALDRVAQYLFAVLMTEGYQDVAYAQSWTGLLLYCDAISRPASSTGIVDVTDGRFAQILQPTDVPVPWYTTEHPRFLVWVGLPAGRWRFYDASGASPDGVLGPVPPGDPLVVDGRTVYRAGSWFKLNTSSDRVVWYAGTDQSYYLTAILGEAVPCYPVDPDTGAKAQPPEDPLNGNNPGGHTEIGPYSFVCPGNDGPESNVRGYMLGSFITNPDPDLYLSWPPVAYTGQVGEVASRDVYSPSSWGEVVELVAAGLPHFPGVTEWLERNIGRAVKHQRWQRLARSPRIQGSVDAQARDREVVLRGRLRVLGHDSRRRSLAYFDDTEIPPPPILPDDSVLYQLPVTTADGRHAAVAVQRAPGSHICEILDIGQFGETFGGSGQGSIADAADPEGLDQTIIFDGCRWPTDITLY